MSIKQKNSDTAAPKGVIVHVVIFSSLQDEGTESQLISMPAAGQNSFCIQSVSLQVAVTFSDTAVETVIVTTVPYFNKSTDIAFFDLRSL